MTVQEISWFELRMQDVSGEQTIKLLGACLVKVAHAREAGTIGSGCASAPAGFSGYVLQNLSDFTNSAFVAACDIPADYPAPVVAWRAANRVLCRAYRAEKRQPSALTVSYDNTDAQAYIDAHAVRTGTRTPRPEDAITVNDLMQITRDGAGRRENVGKRIATTKTLLDGWRELDAAQRAKINARARKRLVTQIAAYCLA